MNLSNLPKIKSKSRKILGRGQGGGKGKTSGRGMKGQKARSKVKASFEGGQLKIIKRLPFVRGIGFRQPSKKKTVIINLNELSAIGSNLLVTVALLAKEGVIKCQGGQEVKILGKGEVQKAYQISSKLKLSQTARRKIEAAGGKII